MSDETTRLKLWDTAGQERFRSLIPAYLAGADVAVVVWLGARVGQVRKLTGRGGRKGGGKEGGGGSLFDLDGLDGKPYSDLGLVFKINPQILMPDEIGFPGGVSLRVTDLDWIHSVSKNMVNVDWGPFGAHHLHQALRPYVHYRF